MRKLLSEMILDLGKCTNHIMHESESAGELLKVRNHFLKQFSHKVLYNYTLKFIFESVSVRIERKKKDFQNFQTRRLCYPVRKVADLDISLFCSQTRQGGP